MLAFSTWEFHLWAIISKYLGDSSRCLIMYKHKSDLSIWCSPILQASPLLKVSKTSVSPLVLYETSLYSSCYQSRSIYCVNRWLLNDISRLYHVTWHVRSTVDASKKQRLLLKSDICSIFRGSSPQESQTLSLVKRKVPMPWHSLWSLFFCTSRITPSGHSPPHGYQVLQTDSWVFSTYMPGYLGIMIYFHPWPTIQSHLPLIKLS